MRDDHPAFKEYRQHNTLCVIDLEQGVWLHTLDSRRGDARTSRIPDIAVDSSGLARRHKRVNILAVRRAAWPVPYN